MMGVPLYLDLWQVATGWSFCGPYGRSGVALRAEGVFLQNKLETLFMIPAVKQHTCVDCCGGWNLHILGQDTRWSTKNHKRRCTRWRKQRSDEGRVLIQWCRVSFPVSVVEQVAVSHKLWMVLTKKQWLESRFLVWFQRRRKFGDVEDVGTKGRRIEVSEETVRVAVRNCTYFNTRYKQQKRKTKRRWSVSSFSGLRELKQLVRFIDRM